MEYVGRHLFAKTDHPLDTEGASRSLDDESEQLKMAIARENNVNHTENITKLFTKVCAT
jgi:hypothetical protein